MKENAIQNIHRMGKAGHIITVIMRVLLMIGIVGLAIGIIALAAMPKGFLTVTTDSAALFKIDLAAIGRTLSPEEQTSINGGGEKAVISLDDDEFDFSGASATETEISVSGQSGDIVFDLHDGWWRLIPVLLTAAAGFVSLVFAGRLCRGFKTCGSPFEAPIIEELRRFAWSLIPLAVLTSFGDGVMNGFFDSSAHFSFSLNLTMIVAVLIVFLLVQIFKYGAVLQRESDETL